MIEWMQTNRLLLLFVAEFCGQFCWLMCVRKQFRMSIAATAGISLLNLLIAFPAMKLLAILEVGGDLSRAANMRLFGAVYISPIHYYVLAKLTKRPVKPAMDACAVGIAVALGIARLDCMFTGCCDGVPIPGMGTLRWPLREVELLYYMLFVACFAKKMCEQKTYGQLYPLFMMTYGAARFLMEWVREEYTTQIGIFHLAHFWALLSLVIGAGVYFPLRAKRKHLEPGTKGMRP